jgi:hypothetical protein
MSKRTFVLAAAALIAAIASAAQVAADIGGWQNVGTLGNCQNGHSVSGDGTALVAISLAAGWSVIAQSNTNCTTPSATYGNSRDTTCHPSFTQHRCISIN